MNILHITPELAQAAKAGGLGDVIYGLAKAQIKLGHDVKIVLPKYDNLLWHNLTELKVVERELWVTVGTQRFNNSIWEAKLEELTLLLIEPYHPNYYFSRGTIYGEHDDIDRFLYFSKVSLEYLAQRAPTPDTLHIHDWPTAIVAPLAKDLYTHQGLKIPNITLTIHNLQYQGLCAPYHLSHIGLDGNYYLAPERMQDPSTPLLINLLKGGITYSDTVTTVSPTYVQEIRTPLGGFGLDGTIQASAHKLSGILNGIDEAYWNPQTDPLIASHYPSYPIITQKKMTTVVAAKQANKRALQKRAGLATSNVPIVASVTRMVSQKGPELILDAIRRTLERGAQFVLLGSLPEGDLLERFNALRKDYPKDRLSVSFNYDEELAHLIYSGADILVIPSLFEPCGLTQMIAMRYGTLPVVRKTGGLADTVFDIDTSEKPKSKRNGYTFDFPDRDGVHWALDRAITTYETSPTTWGTYMYQAMNQDFSWKNTAPEYIETYKANFC